MLSTFILLPLFAKLILGNYIADFRPWNLSILSQPLYPGAPALPLSMRYLKKLVGDLEMWLQEFHFGGIIQDDSKQIFA